ncbi:MAG: hypothetical protein CSA44_00740 [Gammaproteobacteria bacterium]|nr:MAG: hypothetical protein CSA44_00740 [Gammaproteobacteria bacterium]
MKEAAADAASVLPAMINRYQGCWVDLRDYHQPEHSDAVFMDTAAFTVDLNYSLSIWQAQGIKVVWLPIPQSRADLVASATNLGFEFHHVAAGENTLTGENTLAGENTLVLTKRLLSQATIPPFANHTVGTGGIVINSHRQVLTVVEKHDMLTRPGHFKFPGGGVDRQENLAAAVVREVKEETGVIARFHGIVGFLHSHGRQFGNSDLYLLCHLTAESEAVTPCPNEIGQVQWMDIDDYLDCNTVLPFNKAMLQAALAGNYFTLNTVQLSGNERVSFDEVYQFCSAK